MNKDFAFVLGNGKTRLLVNPQDLPGITYGCNRIYQEFAPDVLVSTDQAMAHEIQKSGYSRKYKHYTRQQNIIKDSGALVLPNSIQGMSSGPACIGLACMEPQNYIFLLGMDLKSSTDKINNVYAGTENYRDVDASPTPYTNWSSQIHGLVKSNPSKRFIHVNPLQGFTPESWLTLENFEVMDLCVFRQMINN